MKAFVGSGLLGMPFAFKNSGIWLGSVAMLILSVITLHCILILVASQTEIAKRKMTQHLEEEQEKHATLHDNDSDSDDVSSFKPSQKSGGSAERTKSSSKNRSHHLLNDDRANSDYESTAGTYSSSENDISDAYQHQSPSTPLPYSATSTNAVEQPYTAGQLGDMTEFSLNVPPGDTLEQSAELEKFAPNTFGEVGEYALTRIGRIIIELLLVFTQTGFCIAYLIFISNNLHHHVPALQSWMCVGITGLLLIPFALIRNIKYLTPFSIISEFTLIVGLTLVIYFDVITLQPSRILWVAKQFPLSTFPTFLGVAIYSFEGVGLVLPIHNNMKKRSSFRVVVIIAFISYLILMMLFGLLGYLAFGEDVKDIITDDLDDHPVPRIVIDICLIIALFFTYPIQLFPVPELADSYLRSVSVLNNFVVHFAVRIAMVIFTVGGAILGGDYFGIILSYIGAVGGSSLAYTLPGLIHLVLFWKKNNWFWRLKDLTLALFGLGCLALTLVVNTYHIVTTGEGAG